VQAKNLRDSNGTLCTDDGYENSPVLPGDALVRIEATWVHDMAESDVPRALLGRAGDTVELVLRRNRGMGRMYSVTLMRFKGADGGINLVCLCMRMRIKCLGFKGADRGISVVWFGGGGISMHFATICACGHGHGVSS